MDSRTVQSLFPQAKVKATVRRLAQEITRDYRDKSPTIDLPVNPMKDIRVREAIARAIDVDTIVKVIMNGLATPSDASARNPITGVRLSGFETP